MKKIIIALSLVVGLILLNSSISIAQYNLNNNSLFLISTPNASPSEKSQKNVPKRADLVEEFWKNQSLGLKENNYYNYISKNPNNPEATLLREFLAESIERSSLFLEDSQLKNIHKYVYVHKSPTITTEGVGIIAQKTDKGQVIKYIGLKKIRHKIIPKIEIYPKQLQVRDYLHLDTPMREYMYSVDTVITEWEKLSQSDGVLKSIYYSPEDIKSWKIKASIMGNEEIIDTIKTSGASARAIHKFNIKIEQTDVFRGNFDIEPHAKPRLLKAIYETVLVLKNGKEININKKSIIPDDYIYNMRKRPAEIKISYPSQILQTQYFNLEDKTLAQKKVFIDGKLLNEKEKNHFLNGSYLFPLINQDKIYNFTIIYKTGENLEIEYSDIVMVHSIKPRITINTKGILKENRAIYSDLNFELSDFAKKYVKIADEKLNLRLENQEPFYRKKSPNSISFLAKKEGKIYLNASAKININPEMVDREISDDFLTARSLDYSYYIAPDLPPACILHGIAQQVHRREKLKPVVDFVSLDGDKVAEHTLTIQKKSENGYEDFNGDLEDLTLGEYRLRLVAIEAFDGETFNEFLDADSVRESEEILDFEVANLAPITAISINLPKRLPKIDALLVSENAEFARFINEKQVSLANEYRKRGYDFKINHWDHTLYNFVKDVYDSKNSGESTPSKEIYYNRSGYRGWLYRYDITNSPSYKDYGYYKNIDISKTVERIKRNTSGGTAVYRYNEPNQYWDLIVPWHGENLPESIAIWEDGHRVMIHKIRGYDLTDPDPNDAGYTGYHGELYYRPFLFEGLYQGVLNYSKRVWQPDWVSIDNYTGHYRGNVSKSVIADYSPNNRHISNKVAVIIGVPESNHNDLIKEIQKSSERSFFIAEKASQIYEIIDNYLGNLLIASPPPNTVLVGEKLNFKINDSDPENDPIKVDEISCTHNPNVFDNPTKKSDYIGKTMPERFNYAGKYLIKRRIEDIPTPLKFSQKSNMSELEITVHRPPIADFDFDCNFDISNNQYDFKFYDQSYDPDFESKNNKGIIKKVFRYKLKSNSAWIYKMPQTLTAGKYLLSYIVQDEYGAWSEENIKSLNLNKTPEVDINAALKTEAEFSVNSVPAGEKLIVHNINTKYHMPHHISIHATGLPNKSKIPKIKLDFKSASAQPRSRYQWPDQSLILSKFSPDGNYNIRVSSSTGEIMLPFTVNTPVFIEGKVNDSSEMLFSAETGKYSNRVTVTAFYGTPYAFDLELSTSKADVKIISSRTSDFGGKLSLWSKSITLPDIPKGNYTHIFTTYTASGKSATDRVNADYDPLKIINFEIDGAWNHWQSSRYLSYEKLRFTAELSKKLGREKLILRLSPELMAMVYTNSKMQVYKYEDEIGYKVKFPIELKHIGDKKYSAQYILPLAKSTLSFDNNRLSPPYFAEINIISNKTSTSPEGLVDSKILKLDLTGNIHDLMYIRPKLK